MQIGLIDVDSHNFPNLPLMKLAAWHKSLGDNVESKGIVEGNMERLTERTNDGILVKEDYGEDVLKTLYLCYDAEPMPHYENCEEGYCAIEKLAEYEDLEEQCIKENSWGLRMLLEKWKEFFGDIQELYKYKELEKQGKLLKLPCAVGDTVYTLNPLSSGKTVIGELTADAFFCALSTIEGRFEKTVFLTQEEAEAALKG